MKNTSFCMLVATGFVFGICSGYCSQNLQYQLPTLNTMLKPVQNASETLLSKIQSKSQSAMQNVAKNAQQYIPPVINQTVQNYAQPLLNQKLTYQQRPTTQSPVPPAPQQAVYQANVNSAYEVQQLRNAVTQLQQKVQNIENTIKQVNESISSIKGKIPQVPTNQNVYNNRQPVSNYQYPATVNPRSNTQYNNRDTGYTSYNSNQYQRQNSMGMYPQKYPLQTVVPQQQYGPQQPRRY